MLKNDPPEKNGSFWKKMGHDLSHNLYFDIVFMILKIFK